MAFSYTHVASGLKSDGTAWERGTFDGDSVTTGTIVSGSSTGFPTNGVKIGVVVNHAFASDGDNAVSPALDVADGSIKITFTSSDTGDYYIEGPAVGS